MPLSPRLRHLSGALLALAFAFGCALGLAPSPAAAQYGQMPTSCPPNADCDNLPDDQDACPAEYGPNATMGCPDRDFDAVADRDDACPDVRGEVAAKGCPDGDRDGVADTEDRCKRTRSKPVDVDGCGPLRAFATLDARSTKEMQEDPNVRVECENAKGRPCAFRVTLTLSQASAARLKVPRLIIGLDMKARTSASGGQFVYSGRDVILKAAVERAFARAYLKRIPVTMTLTGSYVIGTDARVAFPKSTFTMKRKPPAGAYRVQPTVSNGPAGPQTVGLTRPSDPDGDFRATASSAAGSSSLTQTVPAGGTLSTGEATPADPIKVSITSKQGGTYRIDTIADPATRNGDPSSFGRLDYRGPQIAITPPCGEADPGCERYATTIVIDSSLIPAPGNGLFGVIGKNRLNTKAEITGFCARSRWGGRCYIDDPLQRRGNADQPRHTVLPNGDISIAIAATEEGGPNLEASVLDFGTVRRRVALGADRTGDLEDLLDGRHETLVFCNLRCTPALKLSVSATIARKFKLGSTTIASRSFGAPGDLRVAPSAAVRRKLRNAKRLTVTVALTARGDDGKVLKGKGTTVFTPAAQDG